MKKGLFVITLCALLFSCLSVSAQERIRKNRADKNTEEFYYDVEAYRNMQVSGSIQVKVWSYAADINVAKEQATKNAVHAALFRGIPGNADAKIQPVPPLITDFAVEDQYKEFFDSFLEEHGPYLRYATKSNNAQTMDIVRLSKKVTKVHKYKYKVGVVVTLQHAQLKQLLEQKGIIKKLNAGFSF